MGRWRGVTHRNDRKRAARVDRNIERAVELGAGAVTVAEASGAAAGERGGLPGGEDDTPDAIVAAVLRCIMLKKVMSKLNGS